MRNIVSVLGALVLSGLLFGCALWQKNNEPESLTVYQYQPLNPTTIWYYDLEIGEVEEDQAKHMRNIHNANWQSEQIRKSLLNDLDTETVRIYIDSLTSTGHLNKGGVGLSVKNEKYLLIVDYIKYFSASKKLEWGCSKKENGKNQQSEVQVQNNKPAENSNCVSETVPIYAGIGVRIRAEFVALQKGVDISGLTALALAANSNKIRGSLTVSTLGITGPEISPLMPIISDISVTSIQNAVQAVGAIKAKIWEDDTIVNPKLIGYELTRADPATIKKVTEALYSLNLVVYPVVSDNPEKNKKCDDTNQKNCMHWIKWSLDSEEEVKRKRGGKASAVKEGMNKKSE